MQLGRIEAKKATVVLEALLAGGDDTGVNVALVVAIRSPTASLAPAMTM
jgi:hypothetical protein